MTKEILMQFLGFHSNATAREYMFLVWEPPKESREFTVTIAQEAFHAHRVSFQDGPDVCSLKLRRELATSGNQPSESLFHISNAELEEYRTSHSPRKRSVFARKPTQTV